MTVLPCNLQSDSILSIDMRFRNAPLENPISNSVPQAILFLATFKSEAYRARDEVPELIKTN